MARTGSVNLSARRLLPTLGGGKVEDVALSLPCGVTPRNASGQYATIVSALFGRIIYRCITLRFSADKQMTGDTMARAAKKSQAKEKTKSRSRRWESRTRRKRSATSL